MAANGRFSLHRFVAALLPILASCTVLVSGNHHDTVGSSDTKNDITYSTAVPTPHVRWASRIPGGPIRGFFIPSVQHGRDMVELMQRLELAPTTVTIDRNWDMNCWGIGDYYGHEFRGDRDDFRIVYSYVEKELTGPESFEVIFLPGLNGWSRMTRPTRDAILRRVAEGAGLVLIHPFVGDVKGHPFKGDETEGSLTSYTDPYDFDWGIHALRAFRRWLRQRYESLDSLNREWKSSYKRWGEILPFTTEQAMKSGNFAPWADHRTFMEVSFANAYQRVREAVLAADPNGHIALSGTQETTAYNGCDWYRLDRIIDDFLSYDGGNQWDIHRSFAKQDATIGQHYPQPPRTRPAGDHS